MIQMPIVLQCSLLFCKPIRRNIQRPDLAAKRFGVAAGDPDLVLMNTKAECSWRSFQACVSDFNSVQSLPFVGIPDVAPVFRPGLFDQPPSTQIRVRGRQPMRTRSVGLQGAAFGLLDSQFTPSS